MIPQEEENIEKMYRQFQNLRKKVKPDSLDQHKGEDLYPERQRAQLQHFLKSLKEYPKMTAIMLEHQHKSIKTLPQQILDKFPQFSSRVEKSIACCKKNAQILEKIKGQLEINLKLKKNPHQSLQIQKQTHKCEGEEHSHSHDSVAPSKILGIFNHLCREYSEEEIHKKERYFIEFIKENIEEHLRENEKISQNVTALVLGAGMGRVLVELRDLFKRMNLPESSYFVQGHEQDPEFYLLSEYMLNYHDKGQESFEIYPYIHNFSNHLNAQTPYLPIKILFPSSQASSFLLTFGSFHQLYKSHSQQWSIIITQFFNYSIPDILIHIQMIYKLLKKQGLWIDISTASFQNHLIPYFSYGEFQNVLQKSQFVLVKKETKDQLWYQEPQKLIHEWRKVHYRVMKK